MEENKVSQIHMMENIVEHPHPDTKSPSGVSSTNFRTMREEPWDHRIEDYMKKLLNICYEKSNFHNEAGYHFKAKRNMWGLPTVLIPAMLSPISLMVGWAYKDTCNTITASDYISAVGFMLTAIFTAVYSFFGFGERYTQHFNAAAVYDSIISEVEAELVKHRQFRMQADVFTIRIKMQVDFAAQHEPLIPKRILEKNKTTQHEMNQKRGSLAQLNILNFTD